MINLPKWVHRIFEESYCPNCDKKGDKRTKLTRQGVCAIGLREEKSKKTKKQRLSFFFQWKCPVCKKESIFSGFQTNIHDFIGDMIEISNSPSQDAITEYSKSSGEMTPPEDVKTEGISDAEVNEIKELMENTQFFEDLLDKIGITKEERDRLREAYKDEEQDK
jgi:hypothetical protein